MRHYVVGSTNNAPLTTNFARNLVKTNSRDGMLEEVVDDGGNSKKTSKYYATPAQLSRPAQLF